MSEIKKYRYLFAVLLTVLVFTLGVLGSNLIDDKRQSELRSSLQKDTTDIQSKQLLTRYLEEKESCELQLQGLTEIIEGYNSRLERVQSYEDRSFFQEDEFQNIRRSYAISGLEYWMFAGKIEENCEDYNANTVLFFTEEDCEECEIQGQTLSDIKRIYGDQVLIFSVYTDIKDSMTDLLQNQYDVEAPPTLVINQNHTVRGIQSRSNITEHMQLEEE